MNAVLRGYVGTQYSTASISIHEHDAIPAACGDFDRIAEDLNIRGLLNKNLSIPQTAGRSIAIVLDDVIAYHRIVTDFMLNSLALIVDDGIAVEDRADTIRVIPQASATIVVNIVGLNKEICCRPELCASAFVIRRKAGVIIPGNLVLDHAAVGRTAIHSLLTIVMEKRIHDSIAPRHD